MKNSFSLFEVILVIVLSSIITIYSFSFIKELYSKNKNLQNIEINKLDLLSTKIFLERNKNNLKNLSYKNQTLFFTNSILLENIKDFKIDESKNKISIYINLNDLIIQKWEFLK